MTELVAQYQLNELRFTKFVVKKQMIEVLKGVDIKYLPYDLHSKYYLLCYAINFKPKITFLNPTHTANMQNAGGANNHNNNVARPMTLQLVKQKWSSCVDSAIMWLYSKYLYLLILSVLVSFILAFPNYVLIALVVLAM